MRAPCRRQRSSPYKTLPFHLLTFTWATPPLTAQAAVATLSVSDISLIDSLCKGAVDGPDRVGPVRRCGLADPGEPRRGAEARLRHARRYRGDGGSAYGTGHAVHDARAAGTARLDRGAARGGYAAPPPADRGGHGGGAGAPWQAPTAHPVPVATNDASRPRVGVRRRHTASVS